MNNTEKKPVANKATKGSKKDVEKANLQVSESKVEMIGHPFEPTSAFVYMDKVGSILDVSMITGKNCILFGKGGYGI